MEQTTDLPLTVVITHNHPDHTANARQFEEIWIHPKEVDRPIPFPLEIRRRDVELITMRQRGRLPSAYTMFNLYGFDVERDLIDPSDRPMPVLHDLYNGQELDLGGGRVVTAYECPGHAPGEMIFLDRQTRSLFAGDALNYNLGLGMIPIETAVRYLERMRDLGDQYDGIYNGHHDFRPLGVPLGEDCLLTVIDLCHQLLSGHYSPTEIPSFWGTNRLPLTLGPLPAKKAEGFDLLAPTQTMVTKGRNFLGFNPNNIFEKK